MLTIAAGIIIAVFVLFFWPLLLSMVIFSIPTAIGLGLGVALGIGADPEIGGLTIGFAAAGLFLGGWVGTKWAGAVFN